MVNYVGIFLVLIGVMLFVSGLWLWVVNNNNTNQGGSNGSAANGNDLTDENKVNLKGLGIVFLFGGILMIIVGLFVSGIFTENDISPDDPLNKGYSTNTKKAFGVIVLLFSVLVFILGLYYLYGPRDDRDTEQQINSYIAVAIFGLSIGIILFLIGISLIIDSYGMIPWDQSRNENQDGG